MKVYERRRDLKTNYAKRLALLKSGKNRIVLRLTNLYANIQYVEHNVKGDNVKLTLLSKELKEFGWNKTFKSTPACYLAGYLFGKECLAKKLNKDVILDLGLQNAFKQGRIFSCVKGIKDSGINISVSEDVFPSEDRINGKHNKTEQLFKSTKSAIDAKYLK
jgi:large subunit ribosomal protein L18